MVPYLLLSLPAGALVDRWNRKKVLIVCESIRVVAFASLPVAWVLGRLDLPQLYIVSAVAGSAFVFYNIAEISTLPLLVDREALTRATSVNLVVEWTGENAGPAIGGALTSLGRTNVIGAMFAYATQAAILLVSVFLLRAIRRKVRIERSVESPKRLVREIGDGAKWLFSHSTLRLMTLRGLVTSFVFAPMTLALIVRAREGFHAPPFLIGLMFSLGGVVGLLATLVAPSLKPRVRVGIVLVVGAWVWTIGLLGVASASSMIALMLVWPIMPAVAGIQEVIGLSYRLSLIPADMQGRVNSVVRFVVWGVQPASLALGGYAIARFGAAPALWSLAAVMALTAVASIPLWNAR
jgi:hypothetical protein